MRNISVLVKPASGMCNMTCDYCFYCDEAAKREQEFYGMMSEDTLKNLIRRTMLQAEGVASLHLAGRRTVTSWTGVFPEGSLVSEKI